MPPSPKNWYENIMDFWPNIPPEKFLGAALVHGLLGRCDEPWIVGEAEVVVGAEVKGLAAVLECDFRGLGGGDVPFVLVQAGFLDGCELCFQMILKFAVHGYNCLISFVFQ